MGGCTARLFAQNFDAVLVVIVIFAGHAIFVMFYKKCRTHSKLHILCDLHKLHVPKILGTNFWAEKKRLRQPGRPHQAYSRQRRMA